MVFGQTSSFWSDIISTHPHHTLALSPKLSPPPSSLIPPSPPISTWLGAVRLVAEDELTAAHIVSLKEASATHEASLRALRAEAASSLETMRLQAERARQVQLVSMVVNTLQGGAHAIMRRAIKIWVTAVDEYRMVQEANRNKQIRVFHRLEERGVYGQRRASMRYCT